MMITTASTLDLSLLISMDLPVWARLLLAALAGAVIGLEREKHGRPAGLRTHLLVALGSALMMIVSESFYFKYGLTDANTPVRLDPARVAAQIVVGIGFLGAGVILKEGINVRGLTTAASLWVVAGLGMAFGMGLVGAGAMTAVLALFSLIILKRLEPLVKKDRYLFLTVVADSQKDIYPRLEEIFREHQLRISDISSSLDLVKQEILYQFVITQHRKRIGRELTGLISPIEGVRLIKFR